MLIVLAWYMLIDGSNEGVDHGEQKKKPVGQVISFRVSEDEMATIREIMKTSRKNASAVMREAIRLFIVPPHRI